MVYKPCLFIIHMDVVTESKGPKQSMMNDYVV